MLEITNLARGAVIGVGLAWLLERWVMNLFDQVSAADPEEFPQNTVENSSKLFSHWRIFAGMSIAAAALCVWRQWSPELLSDLILVTALVGIAWIDRKTLLIEGRLVALAMGLRLVWLSFFAPQEMLNSLTGLLVGAGLLYFVGFLYETFCHRQGLGEGDPAVLGLIGMWVDWHGLGAVLLIAALSGILIGGVSLLRQKKTNQNIPDLLLTQIPFAPFLCLGGLIVYLLQETGFIVTGFGF